MKACVSYEIQRIREWCGLGWGASQRSLFPVYEYRSAGTQSKQLLLKIGPSGNNYAPNSRDPRPNLG